MGSMSRAAGPEIGNLLSGDISQELGARAAALVPVPVQAVGDIGLTMAAVVVPQVRLAGGGRR